MFSKEMIVEMISNDLSIIPGVQIENLENDITIKKNKITIYVKFSMDINIIETARHALSQIRYKLIDKTDDKNFSIELIVK